MDDGFAAASSREAGEVKPLPTRAAEQCGVFSSTQAFGDDWTKAQLSYALRRHRISRLRRGAYQAIDAFDLTDHERARWLHAGPAIGAALVTPGASASHSTAAVLRGMPLLFIPATPCVSVVPWLTGEIAGVHVHRCKSRPFVLPVGSVACTGIELTAIDLAREHGVAAGVVALDFSLHREMTDIGRVESDLDRCGRWPGVVRARTALSLANGRSESVLETRSRLRMNDFGLPQPELQVSIGNEWGRFVGRVAFYWDEFGVVGEADGDVKYDGTEPGPLIEEKRREGELADLNLEVVRWGSPDMRSFGTVATRLRRAFARGRRRPHSDRIWTVLPDFDPRARTNRAH